MRRMIPALIVACLVAAGGCGGTPTTPSASSLTNVTTSTSSNFTTETTMVVTDQASWQAMWPTINGNVSPVPALPSIDFTQEAVLVAAMGSRPSGGYAVSFGTATEANGVITVDVTMDSPGARCFTTQAFTSPVTVVRLRRSGRNAPTVQFRITRRLKDC